MFHGLRDSPTPRVEGSRDRCRRCKLILSMVWLRRRRVMADVPCAPSLDSVLPDAVAQISPNLSALLAVIF
ncbi:hypothetical protein E2C01_030733 [Portunus trituberculatus]|uniref:Uncharacterized protein n=1 Tax=Portunus trituberculatus TaxID=210409 RepID=A0A5B7EW55_PORTR|nr:hypothetical protein [Portunus trituberculatus]